MSIKTKKSLKVIIVSLIVFLSLPTFLGFDFMWEDKYIPTTNKMSTLGGICGYAWLLFLSYCTFEFFDKRIK